MHSPFSRGVSIPPVIPPDEERSPGKGNPVSLRSVMAKHSRAKALERPWHSLFGLISTTLYPPLAAGRFDAPVPIPPPAPASFVQAVREAGSEPLTDPAGTVRGVVPLHSSPERHRDRVPDRPLHAAEADHNRRENPPIPPRCCHTFVLLHTRLKSPYSTSEFHDE